MTLKRLLELPSLALTLHSGGFDAMFETVRNTGLARHRAWLSERDLRLGEGPLEHRHLFEPAPSVIGYALTPNHRYLPPEMLEKAAALNIALFTVPPHVNLDRVEEAALSLLAQENLASLAVSSSLQSYLLDALESAKPEREVLERLAVLTGGSFALLTPWGSLLARSGSRGWRRAEGSLESVPEGHLQRGDGDYLVLRTEQSGRLRSVLVAQDADERWLSLLEFARSVLRLAAAQRELEAERAEASRSLLLTEWLGGFSDGLSVRLAETGLEGSYLVALAEASNRRALDTLKRTGDEFLELSGLPFLSVVRREAVIWALSGATPDTRLPSLFKALQSATSSPFRLGLSAAATGQSDVQRALQQARLAAQSVREAQGGRSFENLEPTTWLLHEQPEETLQMLQRDLLGSLREADPNGKLWRTLRAYLRSPSDMASLADELHIHVNTLRYRLKRIEALTGSSLAEPQTLAKFYLAVKIEEMTGWKS